VGDALQIAKPVNTTRSSVLREGNDAVVGGDERVHGGQQLHLVARGRDPSSVASSNAQQSLAEGVPGELRASAK